MNELDFGGRQVLVVGGSSGIGNGIAQAFRAKGAKVAVCGTRAGAADYSPHEGSHLAGLDCFQLDISHSQAVESFEPPASPRASTATGVVCGRCRDGHPSTMTTAPRQRRTLPADAGSQECPICLE